jgi:hypothetical protein
MLQIVSGKFFKSQDKHMFDCKGILYSNFSWSSPIKTCIATIEPVDVYGSVASYVISYVNQIEKAEITSGFGMVRIGDTQIVQQFKLLCLFGLKAYFDTERYSVEQLCRKDKRYSRDNEIPSKFISRILDNQIMGKQEEISNFVNFVERVIGLPREKYKSVINCINTFESALNTLEDNINLAYSMLVYCLESLSQNYDNYAPVWEDFDQNQRIKLERYFKEIDSEKAVEIKKTLLQGQNLKLMKRFTNFITDNLADDYFVKQAENVVCPLKKTDLKQVLANAYNTRSGYVHELKPIMKQITVTEIAKGEVFIWGNEPILTFTGLARLTYQVIYNFILKQEIKETEEINWRNELPGIVEFHVAPQFWIWKHEGIREEHATEKLEGFLEQLHSCMINEASEITDIRELLKKYEKMIPGAKQKYKIQMIILYYLYNLFVNKDYRIDDYIAFTERFEKCFDICCIEVLIAYVLTGQAWEFTIAECENVIRTHINRKSKSLKLPKMYETLLYLTLANKFHEKEEFGKYDEWMKVALFDLPGDKELQDKIIDCIEKRKIFDVNFIFKRKEADTSVSTNG